MSLRVLVVDDCHDTADSLGVILRRAGYVVSTAYSGAQALDLVAEFQPDILIVDVAMPQMSGIELVRHMRVRDDGKRPAIIAVSGLLHVPSFPEACLCLRKPVPPAELLQLLKRAEDP